MPRDEIVKRLVQEVDDVDTSTDEDIPLEHLELRELAKARVIIKSSVKSHFLIYCLVNIFLIFINFFAYPNPINHFFDIWSVWVILFWGFILWIHAVIIWGILKITDIDRKIFAIISLILTYSVLLLVFINYIVIHYSTSDYVWWPWTTGGILLVIGVYAYFVYEIEESGKKKLRIEQEMEYIRDKSPK